MIVAGAVIVIFWRGIIGACHISFMIRVMKNLSKRRNGMKKMY
jgi:hypothetical protein